jgi:hypothetical protein
MHWVPPSPAEQTPALQLSPPGHAAHVAPPLPHWKLDWLPNNKQVVPTQQPLEQLPALHWPPSPD